MAAMRAAKAGILRKKLFLVANADEEVFRAGDRFDRDVRPDRQP